MDEICARSSATSHRHLGLRRVGSDATSLSSAGEAGSDDLGHILELGRLTELLLPLEHVQSPVLQRLPRLGRLVVFQLNAFDRVGLLRQQAGVAKVRLLRLDRRWPIRVLRSHTVRHQSRKQGSNPRLRPPPPLVDPASHCPRTSSAPPPSPSPSPAHRNLHHHVSSASGPIYRHTRRHEDVHQVGCKSWVIVAGRRNDPLLSHRSSAVRVRRNARGKVDGEGRVRVASVAEEDLV